MKLIKITNRVPESFKKALLAKSKELGISQNDVLKLLENKIKELKIMTGREYTIEANTPLALALLDNPEAQKQFLDIVWIVANINNYKNITDYNIYFRLNGETYYCDEGATIYKEGEKDFEIKETKVI